MRDGAPLPTWPGLDAASDLATLSDSLAYADIVGSGETARLLVQFQGRKLAEALGAPGAGKYLDELLPLPYRNVALATCHEVMVTRLPVYTVADMRDCDGRIVHFERLLLPFGQDAAIVDRIMVSLETVSPEGAFENRDLMKPSLPTFGLCTTIHH